MIAYASRTGTRRNLDALRAAGWRLMVSARGALRAEGFAYALDNGAWTAFQEWQKGEREKNELDLGAFARAVSLLGRGADFIVVPDIVQGGEESWRLSLHWLQVLARQPHLADARLLLAVQDGFQPENVRPHLSDRVGIFVGGGDEFKERTLPLWGSLARDVGAWLHVGRVNTTRRVALCEAAGATSFDGSSVSRFVRNLPKLDGARRQTDIESHLARNVVA
jgi:hypothetical protein